MTILLSILFLALMFLGMPVAFAVGVSSLVFYLTSDTIPAQIGVQRRLQRLRRRAPSRRHFGDQASPIERLFLVPAARRGEQE